VKLFESAGRKQEADRYREQAAELRQRAYRAFYDSGRGLFADTSAKKSFSRHANILAVLADAVPAREQAALLERMEADTSLPPLQLYFRFFLTRALKKAGLADRYVAALAPWQEMIAKGMTTFGETAGEPRSECHPWSASPSYDLLATVAGIEPGSAGFKTVRIAPALGPLKRVSAKYPHPLGTIEVRLARRGERGLQAAIVLPAGLEGEFVWNGRARRITGTQQFTAE
jgi:hypothetical protein